MRRGELRGSVVATGQTKSSSEWVEFRHPSHPSVPGAEAEQEEDRWAARQLRLRVRPPRVCRRRPAEGRLTEGRFARTPGRFIVLYFWRRTLRKEAARRRRRRLPPGIGFGRRRTGTGTGTGTATCGVVAASHHSKPAQGYNNKHVLTEGGLVRSVGEVSQPSSFWMSSSDDTGLGIRTYGTVPWFYPNQSSRFARFGRLSAQRAGQ